MVIMLVCFFLLFKMMHVTAQPGFISIDCGLSPNKTFVDPSNDVTYVSDVGFIDTGVNKDTNAVAGYVRLLTVRSFPDGARNCYRINATAGSKYLLKAYFMYGNFDGLNTKPYIFELHLGVNLWRTINIVNHDYLYWTEVITVATADFLSVCLVNIGSGAPFINGLDVRTLHTAMYPMVNASTSVVRWSRYNLGGNEQLYGYPDDPYDRIWSPYSTPDDCTAISTSSKVTNYDHDLFEAPTAIMSTAITPTNTTRMVFSFAPGDAPENTFFMIFHFSELSSLRTNDSRVFDIYINGAVIQHDYSPPYLKSSYVYTAEPLDPRPRYEFSFNATADSTLLPILNAFEVYSKMDFTRLPTVAGDVDAITAIMREYHVKGNWIGDPCAPVKYSWNGLTCSYTPDPQRIISLNLSSKALTGIVSSSFSNLTALQYLDLSYNNLTGEIPDSLGNLPSLQVLNLTGNSFTKPIPASLLEKYKKGLLLLRIDDISPCANATSCLPQDKKKMISKRFIVIFSVVLVILILLVIVLCWRFRKFRGLSSKKDSFKGLCIDEQIQSENRQFTYVQLAHISGNFVSVLGKGGFGFVYHGYLESGKQVAIKMRSQSSQQGTKEFLAEAQNLTKVHHRNLVSLVGYCLDEKHLALVYEYMAKGSLHDHLRGKVGQHRVLSWGERLQIAVQAAQGLEYLHKGCKPPIIHRDIKSSNILLGENMEAKITDFGLSRTLQSDDQTHVSTMAVTGTPGYVDPEYHYTLQLNEKTDVYSFGVVLLEMITGQPPIIQGDENVHIVQYVTPKLAKGELDGIVDERLQGEFDSNSVWKVLELALRCTAETCSQRPIMSEVVTQLKDSLEIETAFRKSENMSSEVFGISQT